MSPRVGATHQGSLGERRRAMAMTKWDFLTAELTSLEQEDDAIFSDELNHASIIDGCRLSRAQVIRYRHGDPDDLAAALKRTLGVRRRLVITDGVFSMDGDIAPLPQIVKVAAQSDAM